VHEQGHATVAVASFDSAAVSLGTTRTILGDNFNNYPAGWAPDGRSLLVTSDRDGALDLYKQALESNGLVRHPLSNDGNVATAAFAPEDGPILYLPEPVALPNKPGPPPPKQIVRLPASGGAAQVIARRTKATGLRCSRAPAVGCMVSEMSADKRSVSF